MKKREIIFDSITHAQIIQRTLYKSGIPVRIKKVSNRGCKTAVIIDETNFDHALELIKTKNFPFKI